VDEQICEDLEKMISALETDRFSLLCNSTSVEALTNKLEVLRTEVKCHSLKCLFHSFYILLLFFIQGARASKTSYWSD